MNGRLLCIAAMPLITKITSSWALVDTLIVAQTQLLL